MSCTNPLSQTAKNFIGISTSAFRSGPSLSFLYNTQTIRRSCFHQTSHTPGEVAPSTIPPPLVRYTSEQRDVNGERRRARSQLVRRTVFQEAQNSQDEDQKDWVSKSGGGNEKKYKENDVKWDAGVGDSQAERRSRFSSERSQASEEHDISFNVTENTKPQLRPDSSSTMTDLERDAFARLFGSLATEAESATVEATEDEDEGIPTAFLEELNGLDGGDRYNQAIESILDQELQDEAPNLERYPQALRGMAAKAQLQLARNRLLRDRGRQETETSKNEVTLASDKEIKRISKLMTMARSDSKLWDVLEQEVFTKVREVDLSKSSKTSIQAQPTSKTNASKTLVSTGSSEGSIIGRDLAVLARVYPTVLYKAIRILITRSAFTPLVFSILPACKALGMSSYVLGVSTPFYNELLAYTWRFSNNLRTMINLLNEMDEAGLTMDSGTWQILERVTLYQYRSLRGDFGEGVRAMEGMSETMRQGKEISQWKREIRRRAEQAALERVQATDLNRKFEREEEEEEAKEDHLIRGAQLNKPAPISIAAG